MDLRSEHVTDNERSLDWECIARMKNFDFGLSSKKDGTEALYSSFLNYLLKLPPGLARYIRFESETGKTEDKTAQIESEFESYPAEFREEIRDRICHLMCYVGTNDEGETVLVNVLKPMASASDNVLQPLMKWNDGSKDFRILNTDVLTRNHVPGFEAVSEETLQAVTGAQKHAANFFLENEAFSDPDLRVFFDPLLTEAATEERSGLSLVEIPLGPNGTDRSVILPIEFLNDFLRTEQLLFPQLEMLGETEPDVESYGQVVDFLKSKLTPERISSELDFAGSGRKLGAPVKAGFPLIEKQLVQLMEASSQLPKALIQKVVKNYIRHFFCVEWGLVEQALITTDDQVLSGIYYQLEETEFGSVLVPLNSLETFTQYLEIQKKNKGNDKIPLPTFSGETAKSEYYFACQSQLAKAAPSIVAKILRDKNHDFLNFFKELETVLKTYAGEKNSTLKAASIDNIVEDFLDITFGEHKRLLNRLFTKTEILTRDLADLGSDNTSLASIFWEGEMHRPLLEDETWGEWKGYKPYECMAGGAGCGLRMHIVYRAIRPDLNALLRLPLGSKIFGSTESLGIKVISSFVEEDASIWEFKRKDRLEKIA